MVSQILEPEESYATAPLSSIQLYRKREIEGNEQGEDCSMASHLAW
jgi:hypothetical protein